MIVRAKSPICNQQIGNHQSAIRNSYGCCFCSKLPPRARWRLTRCTRCSACIRTSPERVAFTVSVSASRGDLPGSARLAIGRVNDAIFAAKADAVTNQMTELAERTVADRSGRTSFAQRVAGRTIRIGRRADTGVFVYSIHP